MIMMNAVIEFFLNNFQSCISPRRRLRLSPYFKLYKCSMISNLGRNYPCCSYSRLLNLVKIWPRTDSLTAPTCIQNAHGSKSNHGLQRVKLYKCGMIGNLGRHYPCCSYSPPLQLPQRYVPALVDFIIEMYIYMYMLL